ncbi:MAG: WecB/TagA/CpsF family glycosyltransferase [Alphaproteobacteria bacterium]|nr:WecB/TagA/CpsF family glycosyltransferase [Alphaproteobacteria bacterium]
MILGLPFDAVCMEEVIAQLRDHAETRKRCFISTPNLNFLIAARSDTAFRQSVFSSDLSLADGMPIIWVARLLGVPLPGRVPGSGLIEALQTHPEMIARPLRVFFFGGDTGLAEKACKQLGANPGGLVCVGAIDPGFGTPDELSDPAHIDAINAADPDFLIVALGAAKGQAWIVANLNALNVPIVSHLGAVIKFIAGDVARAPTWTQFIGLEWLWRIQQEPGLWRRYFSDGIAFAQLLGTRILPLVAWTWYCKLLGRTEPTARASIDKTQPGRQVAKLGFSLSVKNEDEIRSTFKSLVSTNTPIDLDFSNVHYLDFSFLGQLLILYSYCRSRKIELRIQGVSSQIRKVFGWYLCNHLLNKSG